MFFTIKIISMLMYSNLFNYLYNFHFEKIIIIFLLNSINKLIMHLTINDASKNLIGLIE